MFSYHEFLAYVLGAQKNCLIERVLLSTHNICFEKSNKMIFLLRTLNFSCEPAISFLPVTTLVVCSFVYLFSYIAYIANYMDPNQAEVGSELILFVSMKRSSLECA